MPSMPIPITTSPFKIVEVVTVGLAVVAPGIGSASNIAVSNSPDGVMAHIAQGSAVTLAPVCVVMVVSAVRSVSMV
jgi:hypothetical protein